MIQRIHIQILKKRLLEEQRQFIQVVFGPRQIGKTTMVNQLTAELHVPFHYISADGVIASGMQWIEQQWNVARLKVQKENNSNEGILFIDEIQKIENWGEVVKKEWDLDTRNNVSLKVVLLGSSRLLLQKGLTESLAGRYETIYMGHWSFSEMRDAFGYGFEQFVWFGGYPGASFLINDEQRWKNYIQESLVEASISKDILMLTRVDKPALMKKLFELGSLYSGQILSYSKITGQLQDAGNTTTLANYLHLLDTAGLLAGIEKYSSTEIKMRSSSPKFQVYNTALLSSLSEYTFEQAMSQPAIWGRWVESAVGAYLLNRSIIEGLKLYYWRERNYEVDFILKWGSRIVGIEVKSGLTIKPKGMDAFCKKYKPHKIYLVGGTGIPIEEFLSTNIKDLF